MDTRESQVRRVLFWTLLLLGLGVRLWRFGAVPGGLNQDEAFAGYEAWALLSSGRDTAGYAFPVYLTAWGSGMNALETYLMIPFIALFGLKVWAVRLPQLLIACLSLPCVYGVGRRSGGETAGLAALGLTALCPWHVLLSRWGLESNLAPGFLLFGLYFLLRGTQERRFLPLSALCCGLSLYCYATIWPVVPLILALELLSCLRGGKLRADRWSLLSLLLLAVLALPLLLFLAVNFGWLPELRGPILSIPKLLYLRAGELSAARAPENLRALLSILWNQSDGLPWNSAGPYGLYYPMTLPFALLGLGAAVYRCARKGSGFRPERLVLWNLLGALLLCALVQVNVNRANILFFPLLLLAGEGIALLGKLWKGRLLPLVLAAYLCCFGLFTRYYFTDYRAAVEPSFASGLGEAIAAAPEDGTLVFSKEVYYPQVLFYTRTPVERFAETVRYRSYPAAYLSALSFDRYRLGWDGEAPEPGAAYILSPWADLTPFREAGYHLEKFGYYTLAVRDDT